VKRIAIILFIIHFSLFTCLAQDIPPSVEQQLENLTDLEQTETEDDSYLQQLELYRRNPISINTAEPSELRELRILTDLQIMNFISYRRIFGNFLSIYELQAIPTWDVNTLKKISPFLTVASTESLTDDFVKRFNHGRS
jgi:DNA uptake protein ComE-like DNA-binding protein